MKPRLRFEVVALPTADAEQQFDACLDMLADALADRLIARARASIAAELGVDEDRIDRETARQKPLIEPGLGLPDLGEAS